jgi:hypothetical protein
MKLQDFISGLLAGWSQILVGQPFDFVKVKAQLESENSKKGIIQFAK